MSFLRAVRGNPLGRAAVIATALPAVGATAALAASVSGDGTLVGSTGPDTITAGNGNDTVWGLAGADSITAGNGNDVIDGDGQCPPGLNPGDYPQGLPPGEYCAHMQIAGDGGDRITAGNGNDTVFGGGGHNTVALGCGNDIVYGGPLGDKITAGYSSTCQANDQIYLGLGGSGYTGSTVFTGAGDDVIHAQNGVKDTITCLNGNGTTVYADAKDSVTGCAFVVHTADPNPGPVPRPATDRRAARRSGKHRSTHRIHHKKRSAHKTRR